MAKETDNMEKFIDEENMGGILASMLKPILYTRPIPATFP